MLQRLVRRVFRQVIGGLFLALAPVCVLSVEPLIQATAPAAAIADRSGRGAGTVAVCLVGLVQRVAPEFAGLRHVLNALGAADLFVVLSGRSAASELPAYLLELALELHVLPDPGAAGSRAEAQALHRSGYAFEYLDQYSGFTFSQPASKTDRAHDRTNSYQLRDLSFCYSGVIRMETRRQRPYEYILYLRADYYYLSTLPPLRLLKHVHPAAVWIPDGCDSDGLNDRMAIVPRRWASVYFDRWTLLYNSSLVHALRRAGAGLAERGAEWLLLVALRGYSVPVRRFSPVAALMCTGATARGKQVHNARCTHKLHFAGGPAEDVGVQFRYAQEAAEAMSAAKNFARGWVWRATPMPYVQPGCFTSVQERLDCCNESKFGWGGAAICFNDIYYYSRCCGQDASVDGVDSYGSIARWRFGARGPAESRAFDGVWVAPTPDQSAGFVKQGMRPLCYAMADVASRCVDPAVLAHPSPSDTSRPKLIRLMQKRSSV
eukprot:TRINITY_DN63029_c0_g1_i1.p1 TRINITY_DN63029_c0_g1~~TRINITY_DN63029_c0_g1_i1.p1  ORF type:complete len:499 (-),score=32.21 TRINITY_DN63029_c0_g1_i1:345-1814(-)